MSLHVHNGQMWKYFDLDTVEVCANLTNKVDRVCSLWMDGESNRLFCFINNHSLEIMNLNPLKFKNFFGDFVILFGDLIEKFRRFNYT